MTKKFYVAYDGRAEFDTDVAQVLETIGEHFNYRDYQTWRDNDAVLVQYDANYPDNGSNTPGSLTNEVVIGHWRLGFNALKKRIKVLEEQVNS